MNRSEVAAASREHIGGRHVLLRRGVYRGPGLSPRGFPLYIAVDSEGCEVGERVEVEGGPEELEAVTRELWTRLDAADPAHARRKRYPPV